jgi:hypothetical protein
VNEFDHHARTTEPVDYDLTCWYLNRRRVLELVGVEAVYQTTGLSNQMALNAELVVLKDALVAWLNFTKPPTLGQLLIKGELREQSVFTHYSTFVGKGLPAIGRAIAKGKTDVTMAELYSKLDEINAGSRLTFRFHDERKNARFSCGPILTISTLDQSH